MAKEGSKSAFVMQLLNEFPDSKNAEIASLADCTVQLVGQVRKKMVHVPPCPEDCAGPQPMCEHSYFKDEFCPKCGTFAVVDAEEEPTPEVLEAVLEAEATLTPEAISGLDAVLNERGSRYGSFVKHAYITQRIKAAMTDTPNWIILADDMVEALEMIAHKMGRILNGDPTYADSWVDIAGYAQLVADRLEGKVR